MLLRIFRSSYSEGFETKAAFIWQTLCDTGYCTRQSTALQHMKIKHAKAMLKLLIVKYLKSNKKKLYESSLKFDRNQVRPVIYGI